MKKVILFFVVIAVAIISSVKVLSGKDAVHEILTVNGIEAVAGCETASDASKNTGSCVAMVGGGDACVTLDPQAEVDCSGNY